MIDLGLGPPEEIRTAMDEVHSRAVISPDGYKLSLSDHDVAEFYDLNKDPYEMKNLYTESWYRETIEEMAAQLEPWQESINDRIRVWGS